MPETTTATSESSDPCPDRERCRPAIGREWAGRPEGSGLATYYRLRCMALETTVTALERELERKDRRRRNLVARYEELLQGRDCDDVVVTTE